MLLVRLLLILCGLSLWCCPSASAAFYEDDFNELRSRISREWQLIKNDSNRHIKTYARQEDDKAYRSFKVEMMVENISLQALIRLMMDYNNYKAWFWEVNEAKLLKVVSPTEYYVYMVHRAPFGLPNRDVILRATVTPQTRSQRYIDLQIRAVPQYLPERPPYVRLHAEEISLRVTPLAAQRIQIVAQGYVEPGGDMPSWTANFVQRSAPYSIALGAVQVAPRYQQSFQPTIPFPVYQYEDYAREPTSP